MKLESLYFSFNVRLQYVLSHRHIIDHNGKILPLRYFQTHCIELIVVRFFAQAKEGQGLTIRFCSEYLQITANTVTQK